MKKLIAIASLLLMFSCNNDDGDISSSSIMVNVDEITKDSAKISWSAPTNTSGQSIVYKVILDNEVLTESVTNRTFIFTDLKDNKLYNGAIFSLTDNGQETFADFSFTTEKDPISLGSVTIKTQSQLDRYYKKHILLNLTIDGTDITDLSPLQTLESVGRQITIKNTSITSLNGLENVFSGNPDAESSKGKLEVSNNNELTDISAISKICQSVTEVLIENNNKLENLSGLVPNQNIEQITLSNMPVKDLSVFSGVTELNNLTLEKLNVTNLEELENLQKINFFSIKDILELESLSSLKNLTDVRAVNIKNLSIVNLTGLENIEQLEDLYISENLNLISLEGANNIKRIGNGALRIVKNPKLVSLNGLNKVDYIGSLLIVGNENLQSFEGLESLQKISIYSDTVDYYSLKITHNSNLTSLNGIEGIANCDCELAFIIENNKKLSDFCALSGFVNNPNNGIFYEQELGLFTLYYDVKNNAYNPTHNDLKTDLCKQ